MNTGSTLTACQRTRCINADAGRGSIQSAGGPRLKGSPGSDSATGGGKKKATSSLLTKGPFEATTSMGNTSPRVPHNSQEAPCARASSWSGFLLSRLANASVKVCADTEVEAEVKLQIPPSFPVRNSCASIDAGATSAKKMARKLKNAAKRTQIDRRLRLEKVNGTRGL